jgi:uncharacterized protein YjbI with pentapeptide repeats
MLLLDLEKNIESMDLTNADLSSLNLVHVRIIGTKLMGANLFGAKLMNVDLSGANLQQAKLLSAKLTNANLMNANLSHANLTNADLSLANLIGADLTNADLSRTNFIDANLASVNPDVLDKLTPANFRKTSLSSLDTYEKFPSTARDYLVALRVTAGWNFHYNHFYEVNPLFEDGAFLNSECFSQDAFLLIPETLSDIQGYSFMIALGWYYYSKTEEGEFRLSLVSKDWSHIIKTYRNRDYRQIQKMLDFWLDLLTEQALEQFLQEVNSSSNPVDLSDQNLEEAALALYEANPAKLRLISLRIPLSWSVVLNTFYELEPQIEDDIFINVAFFGENILQLKVAEPNHRGLPFCTINLAWYPANSADGAYRLTLTCDDEKHKVKKLYLSRDYREIQAMLNAWLGLIEEDRMFGYKFS